MNSAIRLAAQARESTLTNSLRFQAWQQGLAGDLEVRDQDNNPILGASITVTFDEIEYQGTTNSAGIYTTPWIRNIGSGSHFAEVTDLVLANYDWNKDLDLEGDFDNDAFPDAWS